MKVNNKKVEMNWKLFNRIYEEVSNGYSKKEVIEKYGKDVIDEYERFGDENEVFEGDWE
jgi:bisphosphoglycerate-dependent phosphoglycerate mutase